RWRKVPGPLAPRRIERQPATQRSLTTRAKTVSVHAPRAVVCSHSPRALGRYRVVDGGGSGVHFAAAGLPFLIINALVSGVLSSPTFVTDRRNPVSSRGRACGYRTCCFVII